MVQKYQSPVRVYKYPFELVMAAYERRFPTCKMIPVFVGSEILAEFNSEDGGVTIIERRCKLNVDAPYLLKKIAGVEFVYFIQKNSLDRRKRILKIEAHNESFASRIGIVERCAYTVHPENTDWTCFEQSASLDVKSFFGFENAVEKVAMKQYSQNIKKGKEVIEFYINELLSEGITHIPLFEERKKLPEIKVTEGDKLLEATGQPPPESTQVDVNLKLESEYIERRLGKLTPYQESCLVRLKKWMAEAHQGKVPSDQTLVRFLQAQDYNLEKARENLCQSLVWRKKYQVDKILNSYNLPEVVTRYFPGGWHKHDRSGRPLYILRLGQMDVKGFIKSIGEEGLVKLTLHVCEEGLKKTEDTATKKGKPIYSWTCLLDLEGLNMRHLWRPGVKALLHIIEMVETNYPETMGLVLIVRAPRVFPILWTLVSTFISDNTRSKFIFYGGNDYQGSNGLQQIIDKECLPDFLGGDSQANICEGGLVPKSYYMSEEEYERERLQGNRLFDDSMYHSVSLGKGQVHEWTWYILVEPFLICHDGESVQGTHVASLEGTYVLQWRHLDTQHHHHSFDFPLHQHKAKVMYYYELLKSRDYKGSMSSLQSSHSAATFNSASEQSAVSNSTPR
ncbi:SEC14-like protein 1 [Limulus polyphemus]|uniref:SEC14-like protein 1 n=1 Tax=Limulus polyphemus TaxID=6850 RepID=A0ABM1TC33_LIMPO|nr:SEC14-like protein 1 [Limulus polyphemus]